VKDGAKRRPTHPAAILREELLPALAIFCERGARQVGVTRRSLHRIMAENASITPKMAARPGRFCGNSLGLWLRMAIGV
jgi:antitoxin HigA-1